MWRHSGHTETELMGPVSRLCRLVTAAWPPAMPRPAWAMVTIVMITIAMVAMVMIIVIAAMMPVRAAAPIGVVITGGQGAGGQQKPRHHKELFPGSHQPLLFNLRSGETTIEMRPKNGQNITKSGPHRAHARPRRAIRPVPASARLAAFSFARAPAHPASDG